MGVAVVFTSLALEPRPLPLLSCTAPSVGPPQASPVFGITGIRTCRQQRTEMSLAESAPSSA